MLCDGCRRRREWIYDKLSRCYRMIVVDLFKLSDTPNDDERRANAGDGGSGGAAGTADGTNDGERRADAGDGGSGGAAGTADGTNDGRGRDAGPSDPTHSG